MYSFLLPVSGGSPISLWWSVNYSCQESDFSFFLLWPGSCQRLSFSGSLLWPLEKVFYFWGPVPSILSVVGKEEQNLYVYLITSVYMQMEWSCFKPREFDGILSLGIATNPVVIFPYHQYCQHNRVLVWLLRKQGFFFSCRSHSKMEAF